MILQLTIPRKSMADSQVSSVLPSLIKTVEEEICPVCHDTFQNIEKEGILRVKLVCRQKSKKLVLLDRNS